MHEGRRESGGGGRVEEEGGGRRVEGGAGGAWGNRKPVLHVRPNSEAWKT